MTPFGTSLSALLASAVLLACTSADDTEVSVDSGSVPAEWAAPVCSVDPLPCPCREPSLEFAGAVSQFDDPSETISMVHGHQGGWHLHIVVRVWNTMTVVRFEATVTDKGTGEVISRVHPRFRLVELEDCVGQLRDLLLFIEPEEALPHAFVCRPALIEICGADVSGRQACRIRELLLLPDPADVDAGLVSACEL